MDKNNKYEYLLQILTEQLPFTCKFTLQISDYNIKTTTDLRAEGEQDEHMFLAIVDTELVRFIETSGKWTQSNTVPLGCKYA